jgi:hypothetical protein
LEAFHDSVLAGHLGQNRTLQKIKLRYFWPKLTHQVFNYARNCLLCQMRKREPKKPAGLLLCTWVERPFQKVGLDLLRPFPLSHKGNRQIIVAVDYLTKWVEVKAMLTWTATDVADFFVNQIVLRHGAPEEIVTDQGKCFSS